MKRMVLLCFFLVILVVLSVVAAEAKLIYEFEALPNANVYFSDIRPFIIKAVGEDATATVNTTTGSYRDFVTFKSMGELSLLQKAGRTNLDLSSSGYNGQALSEIITENYKNLFQITSSGDLQVDKLADLSDIKLKLEGTKGQAEIETLMERYRNSGQITSGDKLLLEGSAGSDHLNFNLLGRDGTAKAATVTEKLKNSGLINSLGDLSVSTVMSNPMITLEIDGLKGDAAAQALSDGLYNKNLTVEALGEMNLSQVVERHKVSLQLDWEQGEVTNETTTPNQQTTVVLTDSQGRMEQELTVTHKEEGNGNDDSANGENEGGSETSSNMVSGNEDNVQASVQLGTANGGKITIVKTNPRGSEPVLTDAELVSRRMGVNINQARTYLNGNGGISNFNYAWSKASSFNPTPPTPVVAGGGGANPGPTSIDIATLSRPEFFNFHLTGPRYNGFLTNSILYMRLYSPSNGQQIRGLNTTITVAEKDAPNNILLVQELPYDYEGDSYRYTFDKKDWLVDFSSLSGPYILLIDSGQSLNIKLNIVITEDGEIKPPNG